MRCSRRAFLERHSAALRPDHNHKFVALFGLHGGALDCEAVCLEGPLQMENPPDDMETGNVMLPALR
ncbi:hypothetical protein [Microvirga massiliensis]|uniref:hypothetical protein n=1 Tax=Microvirga massiliensis TaxID=1033741 RepID=UPI00062BD8F0|nr:hypothetical protein [Microvirga massiliensis]